MVVAEVPESAVLGDRHSGQLWGRLGLSYSQNLLLPSMGHVQTAGTAPSTDITTSTNVCNMCLPRNLCLKLVASPECNSVAIIGLLNN